MNNEEEILQQLYKGDENAMKIIFDEYYEHLCLYAESIVRNHESAEEIVEDLFVAIWLKQGSSPIKTSLKNYLYKSTYNNCLKYIRKTKTEMKLLSRIDYIFKDHEILHPVSSYYPLSNLLYEELKQKVDKVFQSLPVQCKKIFSLSCYENLSYKEIARKLNVSTSTVKTQMSRAFKRFRNELHDYFLLAIILFSLIR